MQVVCMYGPWLARRGWWVCMLIQLLDFPVVIIIGHVAIQSIQRQRVFLQVCCLSRLSVGLSVGLSECPESVLWQNS